MQRWSLNSESLERTCEWSKGVVVTWCDLPSHESSSTNPVNFPHPAIKILLLSLVERQVFYSINQENKAAWGNGNVPAGLASQRPTVPSQRPRGPIDGRVRPGREEFSS